MPSQSVYSMQTLKKKKENPLYLSKGYNTLNPQCTLWILTEPMSQHLTEADDMYMQPSSSAWETEAVGRTLN